MSPEDYIRAATYPDFVEAAVNFFNRIDQNLAAFDEPIDFGVTALDIGSRYGQYVPALYALGLEDITVVEPEATNVRAAIRNGMLDADHPQAFIGTLEERARFDYPPVDTAFVLNMYPRVLRDIQFVGALAASVRPGGLVVASFARQSDGDELNNLLQANPGVPLRALVPSPDRVQHVPMHTAGPAHTAICLLRREHDILSA
ncbi:MAG TPA: hypothetical protein VLI54_05620 [Bacillota bacterium]|nr:hypothetical protein [Bacillota bacterium]